MWDDEGVVFPGWGSKKGRDGEMKNDAIIRHHFLVE
jgi:hypothetical protein